MTQRPSSKHVNTRLNVTLVGLDTATRHMVESVINGFAQPYARVSSGDEAHIDLVNISGDFTWLLYEKIQKRPCIVLSDQRVSRKDAIWVSKPLIESELRSAITRARQFMPAPQTATIVDGERIHRLLKNRSYPYSSKALLPVAEKVMPCQSHDIFCGDKDDFFYLSSSEREKIEYDPGSSLHSWLGQAIEFSRESGRNIQLDGLKEKLLVLAGGRYVFTPMNIQVLQQACARSYGASELCMKSIDADLMVNDTDPGVHGAEAFLWRASLLCSAGRLPHGQSFTDAVELDSWPNFPRLLTTPHAMQIASLWARQPVSILSTAQKLGIPIRYIVSFFSACKASGLVREAAGCVDADSGGRSASTIKWKIVSKFSSLLTR